MKLGDSQDCTVVDRDKDPTAGLPSTTLVPLATDVGRPAVGVAGDNDLLHEFPHSGPIRIDDIRISTFGILTAVQAEHCAPSTGSSCVMNLIG